MLNSFFSYFKNKKGQGLSVETIIVLVLLLIVLVVVVLIFTGQSKMIFDNVREFFGLINETPKNLTGTIK
ncbi:hypothetical protein J4438_01570 [Candidatus Woesearchaeota archaeon]|nr:hypothetical protein [Candidatus Woesearchaeota archaeon]